jgi:hypothetical protein
MKLNVDTVRLLGAVTLALNGECTRKNLLSAILQWQPFKKMVERESKNRA